MNALTKAFADADRSYASAKASVSTATDAVMARGPSGPLTHHSDLSKATEQLKHFRGWVYSSIRPIAQRIAGQPIHVGRLGSERRLGTKSAGNHPEPLDSHEILDLLADPNDLMVSWSLMFSTVASLELTGRSLWWLPGKKQILPIPSSWLVGFQGTTRFEAFKVRPPGTAQAFDLSADECCYFSYPDPADPHGAVSPLQAVGGAVDADEAMTVSQTAIFRQGIHPTHVIRVGKDSEGIRPRLSAAQQRQIISAVRQRYAGVERSGEPLILDGLIEDVSRLSNTVEEMDYLQSGKMVRERIQQGFGTSPYIIGGSEPGSRAASAVASQHFCDYTVNPKLRLMSECMTEWLSPMFGGGLRIWIEPAVAHDAEMALRWAEMLARNGVITAHELRRLAPLDLPEERTFDGQLVGGKNMNTTNLIESGLRAMVDDAMAGHDADELLARVDKRFSLPSPNGRK